MLVYHFNSFYLIFNFTTVTALVRSFNMYINKIGTVFKFFNSSLAFTVKVGIKVTCSAVNINTVHSCTDCNTF